MKLCSIADDRALIVRSNLTTTVVSRALTLADKLVEISGLDGELDEDDYLGDTHHAHASYYGI